MQQLCLYLNNFSSGSDFLIWRFLLNFFSRLTSMFDIGDCVLHLKRSS